MRVIKLHVFLMFLMPSSIGDYHDEMKGEHHTRWLNDYWSRMCLHVLLYLFQPRCTEWHRSVLKFEQDVDAQLFDQQKGLLSANLFETELYELN